MPKFKKTRQEFFFEIFTPLFEGAEKKTDFELYTFFREAFFTVLKDQKGEKAFQKSTIPMESILKLSFLEQAYMDNMWLCMTILFSAPERYEYAEKIIDKYIRPTKPRQAFQAFKEEMAGLFVFALKEKYGASSRQLTHLASQMFILSETCIKDTTSRIRKAYKDQKFDIIKEPMALIPMYIALNYFTGKSKLKAIQEGTTSSEKRFKVAMSALNNLNKQTILNHFPPVKKFIKKYPESIAAQFLLEKKITLNFVPETIEAAFLVISCATFIKFMPNLCRRDYREFK